LGIQSMLDLTKEPALAIDAGTRVWLMRALAAVA
jgi:hypothetical protein